MQFVVGLIALVASISGAISGVGGGVIIKPVLDATGLMSVSTIGFYSGCTVLSMTSVNLLKSFTSGSDVQVDLKRSGFLAVGAVIGGYIGNWLFQFARVLLQHDALLGLIQSVILFLITLGVMIFTLLKQKIKFKNIQNPVFIFSIGLILGAISSFLGIGGGPINIAVIFYFLGMNSKDTALNSLFVVFCSQITSIGSTIIGKNIPVVNIMTLFLMICGGVFGGLIGSKISKKFNNEQVDKFFIALLSVLCIINIYNIVKFGIGI